MKATWIWDREKATGRAAWSTWQYTCKSLAELHKGFLQNTFKNQSIEKVRLWIHDQLVFLTDYWCGGNSSVTGLIVLSSRRPGLCAWCHQGIRIFYWKRDFYICKTTSFYYLLFCVRSQNREEEGLSSAPYPRFQGTLLGYITNQG